MMILSKLLENWNPEFSLDKIEDLLICNTCYLTIYNFTDEPYLNFDDHRLEACESSFEVNSFIPLTVKLTVNKTIDRLCQIYNAEFKHNNNGDDNSIERRTTGLGNTLTEGNRCDRKQLENYKLFKNHVPGIYKAAQLLNRQLTDKSVNEFVLYKCQQCNFQTIYKRNLKRHRIIHDLFVVYKGSECTYKTNDKAQLKRHVTIHKNSNEIQMYKCNECYFQTIYKKHLIRHLTDRKSENKVHMYKCQHCTFQSKYKCSLKKHTLIHQGNEDIKIVGYKCQYTLRYNNDEVKTYSCPKGQYETLSKYNMRAHLLMHKTKNHNLSHKIVKEVVMYKCQQCTYQAKRKSDIKRHAIMHKNENELHMYKCHQCTFQSKYKRHLKRHILIHQNIRNCTLHLTLHNDEENKNRELTQESTNVITKQHSYEIKMYKCNECYFHTINRAHLIRHLKGRESGNKVHIYKCDKCTFQTKYKCSFKKHTSIHQGNDDINIMRYISRCKGDLSPHLSIHNGEVKFSCPKCQYETFNKYNMRAHLLMHKTKNHNLTHNIVNEVVRYECQQCTYQTQCKSRLKRHAIIHKTKNDVHMYQCEQCTFQSKYKHSLIRHTLFHPGNDDINIKRYKCEHCPYKSRYHRLLRLHWSLHNDEVQKYSCAECKYETVNKNNLRSHLLKHNKNRLYKCNECYFQTKYRKHLIRHLYGRKSGNKVHIYKCEQCTFQTKYKCSLKRHTLIHKINDRI